MNSYDRNEKMNEFVNEMNESILSVGDMSIYLFNRFRNFVGYLFITVTMVAIAFICAEFVRSFEFAPILGFDVYYIALAFFGAIGGYLALFGEDAKIATIKGAIFSDGSNRLWQVLGALAIVLALVLVNAKGVQKIADFSLRYMNTELEDSVVFQLKKKKAEDHSRVAQSTSSGVDTSDIDNFNRSRKQLEEGMDNEISARKSQFDAWMKGRNVVEWRTQIGINQKNFAEDKAEIISKWNSKIAKIDWKIKNAKAENLKTLELANRVRTSEMDKSDKATEELIGHYKKESGANSDTIEKYKNIGLIVAISGEIIDGLLAFLLFMIVKSNPNVNGTPKVQRNTRALPELHSFANKDRASIAPQNNRRLDRSDENEELKPELFEQIKKVSEVLAREKENYIDGSLNHPSQREIIKAFSDNGKLVTPQQIGDYFAKMGDGVTFVNQKKGFVYSMGVAA